MCIRDRFTDEFAEPGDRSYWVYDYGAIAPHVDAIRIMLYDKSSARTAPGPIAPIDWAERAIDSATAEIGSPEKLVFGIPIYGTNWVTATEGQCPDSAESHISQSRRRIDEILVSRDTTEPVYDEATGETTFTYDLVVNGDTTCTQTRLVRYVDNEGMRARMQLSIDKGMLGVALFAFGYEDEGIWSDIATINAELTAANSTA